MASYWHSAKKNKEQKAEYFSNLPNRFALVDDLVLSSQGIHCMPYKNYYVFYEIEETMNTVVLLRVGYNRKNWKEILLKK